MYTTKRLKILSKRNWGNGKHTDKLSIGELWIWKYYLSSRTKQDLRLGTGTCKVLSQLAQDFPLGLSKIEAMGEQMTLKGD